MFSFVSCVLGSVRLHHVCGIFGFLTVCLISFTPPCNGGNILVFPVDGSHWINMRTLLETLHAKGHNLTVIRASTSMYIPEKSPLFTSITIDMKESFDDFFGVFLKEQLKVCHLRMCLCGALSHLHIKIIHFFTVMFFSNNFLGTERRSVSTDSPQAHQGFFVYDYSGPCNMD